MPHNYTKLEVADVIDDFLNGRGGAYDFDDFCTFTITDPELDKIRERCDGLQEEFPPEKPGEYCGSKGMDVLRGYVSQLRQQAHEEEERMAAPIKAPIIVVCDEVLVFETLSSATTFIEPWDTDDCSPVYDSEGRLLRLYQSSKLEERPQHARPKAPSWLPAGVRRYLQRYMEQQLADMKLTKIEALEQEPSHQDDLREVLINWLVNLTAWLYEHKGKGVPLTREGLSQESLEELVSRALEYSE